MTKYQVYLYKLTQEDIDRYAGVHVNICKLAHAFEKMHIPVIWEDNWKEPERRYIEFQTSEDRFNEVLSEAINSASFSLYS